MIIEAVVFPITIPNHTPVNPILKPSTKSHVQKTWNTIVLNIVVTKLLYPCPIPWNIPDVNIPNGVPGRNRHNILSACETFSKSREEDFEYENINASGFEKKKIPNIVPMAKYSANFIA